MVDKMMRLFIIQAISGFVTRDYDTGLHFLNEVKTHFAQNQSTLNSTLKGLAKEIIQSLDMLAPGTSAAQFKDMSFQEEQSTQAIPEGQEVFHTPNQELSSILNRRKTRKPKSVENKMQERQNDDSLFGNLGELDLNSVDNKMPVEEHIPNTMNKSEEKNSTRIPEFSNEKEESITAKIKKEQVEDNKILEILLKRKKMKGQLTPEDEEIMHLIEKKKEEEELNNNPIEKVRRRRKSRRSKLWDD